MRRLPSASSVAPTTVRESKMSLKLFDGSDSSEDEDQPKIEINEEFACRYEHNKKREELQRYEELKKKGEIGSGSGTDSEDDSSEDEIIDSRKHDSKFFDVLIKVKKHDSALKDKEAKLFDSESESEEVGEDNDKKEKRKKPMYLKDVTAKHLIEEGPEFDDREEKKKSYAEEQEELRKAFMDVAEAASDGDDEFLKERKDGPDDFDGDGDDGGFDKKLDEYFGDDNNLDENEMFLKDYFRKKLWLDKDDGGKGGLAGEDIAISEDEEEIERQEDYERGFNFRFEENAGDRVLGHSRVVEGSVRKKTNARKLQRQSKEERLAQAEFERKEELKHLKNLKKKEINEKLRKIRETAGIGDSEVCLLDEDDLEEEFDPDEYDRKMKKAFDDGYYEANDADPGFGSDSEEDGNELEKPDFDKEDELLGLPKGWDDVYGSGDGFSAARERTLKRRVDNVGDKKPVKEEEEVVPEEGKLKKKRKRSGLEEEVLNKELDEYYKLDYEDTIGDLKTRFKYRPVKSKRYGLSTKEVLLMDDKELNQYVSLKKIAPYVEKDWKVPYNKRLELKQRNKSLLEGESSTGQRTGKKNLRGDGKKSTELLGAMESNKPQPEVPNEKQNGQSRRARRKLNQADLKLSRSRLIAYGKISSKSKSIKKH